MELYNTKDISRMCNIPYTVTLTYLGHFSFSKHRYGSRYKVDNDFYKTLIKYLQNKRTNYKYIRNVEGLMND